MCYFLISFEIYEILVPGNLNSRIVFGHYFTVKEVKLFPQNFTFLRFKCANSRFQATTLDQFYI